MDQEGLKLPDLPSEMISHIFKFMKIKDQLTFSEGIFGGN